MKPYYEHAGITIYCGDNLEILPQLEPVDLILTDPPYGILGGSKSIGGSNIVKVNKYDLTWDAKPVDCRMIRQLRKMSSEQVFWGWNHYSECLPSSKSVIVWDKKCQNGWNDTFAEVEIAWASSGKAVAFRFLWAGALHKGVRFGHPTEKPRELMLFCLSRFPQATTVLDPFMGVGPVLVAAKELGRRAIGIEISKAYCDVAIRRLSQEVLPFGAIS